MSTTYVLDGRTVQSLRVILKKYLERKYSPAIADDIYLEIEDFFNDYIENHDLERKE